QAAAAFEHQELEDAEPAGEFAGEDDQIVGVVTGHRGDHDRAGAEAFPYFGDGGIGGIGARAKSVAWVEDGRRFFWCEAAEAAEQLWERARRDDYDASGLIAAELAERENERIKIRDALTGGRNECEEEALAVKFLEIKSFLGKKPGARASRSDEI